MRGDSGVDGDAQRLSQIVWILFLKIFDYKEEEWELEGNYTPIIPVGYRWRDWASCIGEDGKVDKKAQLTGDTLINFVNNKLFPVLQGETIKDENNEDVLLFNSEDPKAFIVRKFMEDSTNYMKNGVQLRKVINEFVDISFDDTEVRYAFNEIYEMILKDLQAAGKAGEFYTPRALTSFVTEKVNPKIGERIADFACGTGGFLVEALKHIQSQVKTVEDSVTVQASLHGIEWKPLPYMLCVTNLLLHDVNNPDIVHDDGLKENVMEIKSEDKFKVILMNPPFGGNVDPIDLTNFPSDLRSSESADLFIAKILFSLEDDGRCGLVLPDGFLSNDDEAKTNLKKKLLSDFNLHTVIRLPETVFAPYTNINTNLLFFDKTGPTKDIWFYRLDMPERQKRFNKSKPMLREDFKPVDDWWNNRVEIKDEKEDGAIADTWKAKKYLVSEVIENGYNLNLCGYPIKEEIILSPEEVINNYNIQKKKIEEKLSKAITNMHSFFKGVNNEKTLNINTLCQKMSELERKFPDEMKNSIIQEAIQGKLTEQLVTDEPVEKFLERVRAEKALKIKEKKMKKEDKLKPITDEDLPFDIPDNWKWVRLGDVGYTNIGLTYKPSDITKDGTIVLRSSNIQKGKMDYNDIVMVNMNISDNKMCQAGDLLICARNGSKKLVGKSAIIDRDGMSFGAFMALFRSECNKYIFYVINSPYFRNALLGDAGTMTINQITQDMLRNFLLPLPPMEEQVRIIEKLEYLIPLFEE